MIELAIIVQLQKNVSKVLNGAGPDCAVPAFVAMKTKAVCALLVCARALPDS
ncbi:hypothetical protein [Comamonas sp.]|uniref:hypothetical protein n=1 Tax=Comamonas sp. TaxID=34028 RepID=UPI00264765A5|nr:hypothetical protein [Comamonas sp.]